MAVEDLDRAVCRQLLAASDRKPCIIAMTGAVEVDAAALRDAGFDGQVTKPIDLKHVLSMLSG